MLSLLKMVSLSVPSLNCCFDICGGFYLVSALKYFISVSFASYLCTHSLIWYALRKQDIFRLQARTKIKINEVLSGLFGDSESKNTVTDLCLKTDFSTTENENNIVPRSYNTKYEKGNSFKLYIYKKRTIIFDKII